VNRSVERRRIAVREARPGELVVGWFVHPTRGRVRCPAAPLVAADLRGQGHRVREAHGWLEPADEEPDGVMFAASYLDPGGAAVGLAVAAHETDPGAIDAAREAVNTWSAAWRSRRLVVATAKTCCADEASAACPLVVTARRTARRFAQRGDQVVLVGHPSPGLVPDGVVRVASAKDVAGLDLDPDRVSYVVAPGTVLEQAMPIVTALRARYPRLRGAHPNSLCYAASDRLASVRAVADGCDRLFVLGDPTATDTVELLRAAGTRKPTHVLDSLDRVRPFWLAGTESIGIATTRSASPALLNAVLDTLSGMGPTSVMHKRVTTEPARDGSWLPGIAAGSDHPMSTAHR
jgi:4-hydroxy-3-methylbut-2-en-1-yl diphosphate reductase